jgi:hypothetical protein
MLGGSSGHKGLDFVRMKYGHFEFLTVVLMKIQVFWDVMPSLVVNSFLCSVGTLLFQNINNIY